VHDSIFVITLNLNPVLSASWADQRFIPSNSNSPKAASVSLKTVCLYA
jgi:hypothetical protein